MDSSGTFLYVSNFGSNTVSVVRIYDRRVLASIPVGIGPDALRLTPDERYLLVLNALSNDLAVVYTRVRSLVTLIPLGLSPRDVAVKTFRSSPAPRER